MPKKPIFSGFPKPPRGRPRSRRPEACALIPLDTARIREQTLRKHKKVERELARLTDKLKRFHEHDVPEFHAWKCRTFGPLLSELRDLGDRLREQESFVQELLEVGCRLNLSEEEAYREVVWRRANPAAAAEKDRLFEAEQARRREAEEKRRQEREARRSKTRKRKKPSPFDFQEFDDLDDLENKLFEEFIGSMLDEDMPAARSPRPERSQDKTAKELYRTIALQLHPDHHGQMSESGKQLWVEAQQAYRDGDVETLRAVLAQCESGEAGLGPNTAVSVILHLIQRLKDALRPVRQQLRQAGRRIEWEFEKKIGDARFARKIESQLQADIRNLRRTLSEAAVQLDDMRKRAFRKNKPKSAQSTDFFPGFNLPEDPLPF